MLPMYCATIAPQSRLPAVIRDSGMPIVDRIATPTKTKPAVNLANRMTHPLMGCVSRISKVPSRCSSASRRIVAAGTRRASSQGIDGLSTAKSTVNSGRSDASEVTNAERKKDHDSSARNTTMRM